jgi:hypothetical protein
MLPKKGKRGSNRTATTEAPLDTKEALAAIVRVIQQELVTLRQATPATAATTVTTSAAPAIGAIPATHACHTPFRDSGNEASIRVPRMFHSHV